jgi:hypothetical protein
MTAFDSALRALFADINLEAAEKTLGGLALPAAYSDESVAAINAAANDLCDRAAALKIAEAPRAERKAVKEQIDLLVNARAFLYRLRPAQPGDVTVAL